MKRIISFLLIASMLFSALAITVGAAGKEEFISEVALVYEDSVEDARKAVEGTGWKVLEHDLNANADAWIDDGVYLIYKTTTDVEEAITDLRVMDMYGGFSSANYAKELEASRAEYKSEIDRLRVAAAEFKALYEAGDGMALLAYRQMNYYKDTKTADGTETDRLLGDFFLDLPADEQVIQVMFEGNNMIVSNLVSLLAVGISGENAASLSTRVAEMYAVKDTLDDKTYYDMAQALSNELSALRAKLVRYYELAGKYDPEDEEMSEEEFLFLSEYAATAILMEEIMLGDMSLADLVRNRSYTVRDLYPLVAALTEGQQALIAMGQLETVLQYNSPSKPIAELNALLDEMEQELLMEDGVFTPYDVYLGVDRSIFKGTFAITNAADRQKALTGETWTWSDAASRSRGVAIGYIVASSLNVIVAGASAGLHIAYYVMRNTARALGRGWAKVTAFQNTWGPVSMVGYGVAAAMALVILGTYGITTLYNYYNPDYTEIPNVMVDVRETDLGDQYVKYTAAKVFEDGKLSEKNADFNAYEGREWNALYYTKDANAGNCLTPNFVFSDSSSAVARRHQGVSMFGETNAFNLNSHVYSSNAKGAYLTVRYSTAKKTAADVPDVVGSIFETGALYMVTAMGGAVIGAGGTLLLQKAKKKKKDEVEPVAAE